MTKKINKELKAAKAKVVNQKSIKEVVKKVTEASPAPTKKVEATAPKKPTERKGFKASYAGGIVGWQASLKPARTAINLALYASLIGASDKLAKMLSKNMDSAVDSLNTEKVRIPSDMLGQLEMIDGGIEEAKVGTKDFTKALRNLKALAKTVEDSTIKKALEVEINSATATAKKAS